MINPLFTQINYWAVLVAGIVYWLFGSLWFSVIFGDTWVKELEKQGNLLKKPSKSALIGKFVLTFILNLIVAFGVALFVHAARTTTVPSAILLGLVIGICFSAATMLISHIWESISVKLILIDIGYPVIGIIISSIILTLWR